MAKEYEEYYDADMTRRVRLKSDSILTTDSYASVPLPTNKLLDTSNVISKEILDRFDSRVFFLRNIGANPILYQIEWSLEGAPNDGTANHWSPASDKKDVVLLAGATVIEGSLALPYTGMRVRIKAQIVASQSNVEVLAVYTKWKR